MKRQLSRTFGLICLPFLLALGCATSQTSTKSTENGQTRAPSSKKDDGPVSAVRATRHRGLIHVAHAPRTFTEVDTSQEEIEPNPEVAFTAAAAKSSLPLTPQKEADIKATGDMKCGTERWNIKTLTDPDALQEQSTLPQNLAALITKSPTTNVDSLTSLPMPTTWSPDLPRQKEEQKMERLEADITGYKLEADSDYHIVIIDPKDPAKKTMIIESPDPKCLGGNPSSPEVIPAEYKKMFGDVRKQFDGLIQHHGGKTPTPTFYKINPPIHVFVTGFVFFDKIHGQTGVASNGIELHPIIDIEEDVTKP